MLAPFAIAKTAPDPAVPWFALRGCSWWQLETPDGEDGITDANVAALNLVAGLSVDTFERLVHDDAFASAAVDVIFQIVGAEPGYKPLLGRLGLSELLTVSAGSNKAVRVNWSWDELVIACDRIASNNWESIQKKDLRIAALSEFLRRQQPEAAESEEFRGPLSVYFKLENIRSAHPDYKLKPTKGGKPTKRVVEAFIADPEGMHKVAQALWRNGDLVWHVDAALRWRSAVVARSHEPWPKTKFRIAGKQAAGALRRWPWRRLFVRFCRGNALRPIAARLRTSVAHEFALFRLHRDDG